jgi:choline monooxygenase
MFTQDYFDSDLNVHPDIRKARGLPRRAFTDTKVAEKEMRTIWSADWLILPLPLTHTQRVRPFTVPGHHCIISEDANGTVHVLPNRCSHQWHPLVMHPRTTPQLICPVHGRTFGLDGKCTSHHGAESCPGFPTEHDHLKPYLAKAIGKLVFMRARHHALDATSTPPLRDRVARDIHAYAHGTLEFLSERVLPGNWKLHVGNYLDASHIQRVHHESLYRKIDMRGYTVQKTEAGILQTAQARIQSDAWLYRETPIYAAWWFVFPNIAINLYAWGASLNIWYPGETPNETRMIWFHLVTNSNHYGAVDQAFQNAIDAEDVRLIQRIAQYGEGRPSERMQFIPEADMALHWFHRKVSQCLTRD